MNSLDQFWTFSLHFKVSKFIHSRGVSRFHCNFWSFCCSSQWTIIQRLHYKEIILCNDIVREDSATTLEVGRWQSSEWLEHIKHKENKEGRKTNPIGIYMFSASCFPGTDAIYIKDSVVGFVIMILLACWPACMSCLPCNWAEQFFFMLI